MAINLTLPQLNRKGFSTKDLIVSILSEEWPLSAKEIFKRTQRGFEADVSYQAVHKVLSELEGNFIVEKVGKSLGSQDPNFDSFIPYTTSKKYIHGVINNEIHGICISAKNVDQTQSLAKQIRKILRSRHNLEPEEPNDFMCIDQKGMMAAAESSAGTLNIFLLIIASISLLVGGIGVMNIMLVSVTERRKEIGIRMALGAPNRVILKQFLIESVVLCFVGGVVGIVLGMIAPYVAHYVADFPVVLKLHPVVISVFTIFLIGIIFGYYPAWKASRLNPVEALLEE